MRLHTILAALAALLVAGTSSAEGVAIDPGQWEMTSTMTMSMMPQPRTTTTMEWSRSRYRCRYRNWSRTGEMGDVVGIEHHHHLDCVRP